MIAPWHQKLMLRKSKSVRPILGLVSIVFLLLAVGCRLSKTEPHTIVNGIVSNQNGETVSGATIRIQTTDIQTASLQDGSFSISFPQSIDSPQLTAWAPGFYISTPKKTSDDRSVVVFELRPHATQDNQDYIWQSAFDSSDSNEAVACAECHRAEDQDLPYTLPVDEWALDVHANTFYNERFQTMYLGTDVSGNQSMLTQFVSIKDYGSEPLKPDPSQPYFGPGYKLDFPDTSGNCAACHTPTAAIKAPYDTDPTTLMGVETEGITCDFCHKIWDVNLDPLTGLPFQNLPGVLSYVFRRPLEGHQFFAGPLDDVAPGEDVYSPLQTQSQFCAPCHFGTFWDVIVYDSFGEWLRSSYSQPETGQTCQDCHMPRLGADHFAHPEKGGLERDPNTIFSHLMPGASNELLLKNAISMTVTAIVEEESLKINVYLVNDQAGHSVPTDSPLRHLILLVSAVDSAGKELKLESGPVLPEWTGIGKPSDGQYAGLPGNVFAKLLAEQWTRAQPTGAYWNPTYIVSDNRLAPFEIDLSTFNFAIQENEEVRIHVRLIYRRAFIDLIEQKGWQTPDILMEETVLEFAP